jgi:hypothetical protein
MLEVPVVNLGLNRRMAQEKKGEEESKEQESENGVEITDDVGLGL